MKTSVVRSGLSVLFVLCCTVTEAYKIIPEVGLDIEKHTNVTNTSTEIEDTIIKPYFGFKIADQTELFLFNIDARIQQERYQDGTFPDEEIPKVGAFLGWKIVPGRLLWAFEDSAVREEIESGAISNPDNFQNVNVFSTGPDLLFSRDASKAVIKLRYNDVSFSAEDIDSNVYTASIFLNRELTAYSRLGVVLYYQGTEYDLAANDNYNLSQLYLRYNRDVPYGRLTVKLGANILEDSNADRTEPYGMFDFEYQPDNGLVGGISYKTFFSDTNSALASPLQTTIEATDGEDITTGSVSQSSADPFQEDVIEARLGYDSGRYSTRFGIYSGNNDYFGLQDEEDKNGAWLRLGVELSSRLGASLFVRQDESTFNSSLGANIDDTRQAYTLRVDYRLSEGLSVNMGIGREETESSVANRNNEDDILFAGIRYRGRENN